MKMRSKQLLIDCGQKDDFTQPRAGAVAPARSCT
jgi:hypothetical protein